jgi:hypothetical protein
MASTESESSSLESPPSPEEQDSLRVDLGDYLAFYPDEDSPDLAKFVATSYEFAEFKVPASEELPAKGELLSHQKLIGRFLSPNTPYSKLLLFVKVGGGKTCTAITVAEHFKHTLVDGFPRKPPIVLVKNEGLRRQFAYFIHSVCTSGLYGFDKIPEWKEEGRTEKSIEESRRGLVKNWYELSTYETFLKSLPQNKEELVRTYSDRLFICDEIHELREHGKQEDLYSILLGLLTVAQHTRVLLMTGTPIWESPWEISSVFNLLLPEEKRLPTGNEFMKLYFQNNVLINEQQLIEAWRGKVSYLRASVVDIKKLVQGELIQGLKHIKVVHSTMSEYQSQIARRAAQEEKLVKGKDKTSKAKKVKGGALLQDARDAMNFVYPISAGAKKPYGGSAFRRFVKEKKVKKLSIKKKTKTGSPTTVQISKYVLDPAWAREMAPNPDQPHRVSEGLRKYSCKAARILQEIFDHPQELAFIYSEEVTLGGAILLSLVLELYGFERVTEKFDITNNTRKRPRYIILTKNPATTHEDYKMAELLATFNNPKNKYGDYIRVIIGSKAISIGYTFKNVRQTHAFGPYWNESREEQAFGRTYRFAAHNDLPKKDRYVKFYSHAAIFEDPEEESTDIYIYKNIETKEFRNAQLFRLLKIISFDCALTYNRNVTESDQDGSRECNFVKCNYECLNLPPTSKKGKVWQYDYEVTNFTNYDILYYYDDIYSLLQDIRKLYRTERILTIHQLYNRLHRNRKALRLHALVFALDVIINSRVPLRNHFGFPCVLAEDHGYYFLDEYADQSGEYNLQLYSNSPMLVSSEPLPVAVEIIQFDQHQPAKRLGRLCEYAKYPSIDDFYKLPYYDRVMVLEQAYIYRFSHPGQPLHEAYSIALDNLATSIYNLQDGTTAHILNMEENLGVSYNAVVRKYNPQGKTRVFVPRGPHSFWSNVTDPEQETLYLQEIKKMKEAKQAPAETEEKYGIIGVLAQDGKFRIRKLEERKSKNKGRVCGASHDVRQKLEFFKTLGTFPDVLPEYEEISREELLEIVESSAAYGKIHGVFELSDLSTEDLAGLASFLASKATNLCLDLAIKMAALGILYDTDGAQLDIHQVRARMAI